MQETIPPSIFFGHAQRLIDTWNQNHSVNFDSIIIINGKASPGNQKTIAILSWFLAGYNLADTILFFAKDQLIIYTSQRKINFLNNIAQDPRAKKYGLAFVKKEDDNRPAFERIWSQIHKGIGKPKVGTLLNDTKSGAIAEEFDKYMKEVAHEGVDILNFFNQCFEIKDQTQIENLTKSALVTSYFQEKFIKEVQKVIDSGRRTKHKDLVGKINEIMSNEAELKKLMVKLKAQNLNKDYIDSGPIASIQSGGQFKHKLFAETDDNELRSDCIILGLGSLYRGYNSYIGRTLLIDPTEYQKSIYKKIDTLYKVVTQNLRVGVKLGDIYKKAKMFAQQHLKDLEMPKSLGFGIGIFLKESTLNIVETSDKVIQEGNVFLIDITFTDIKYDAKKGGQKSFAVQLIDTIVVQKTQPSVLTASVSKLITDISYSLEDDEQEERKKPRADLPQQSNIIEGSRRRRRNQTAHEKLKGQKERNDHQKILKSKKLQELKERINENFSGDLKKQVVVEASKIQSYKSRDQLPKDLKKNMIYIDQKNNTILLPIKGAHIPFHILLLKSVVKSDQGKFASLRFNFHLPNSISNLTFPKFAEPSVFVKEIVFRSQQVARFTQIEKQVKALQKKIRTQTSEKNAKEDIVEQQKLNVNRGKRPILRDLFPRPAVGQKKTKGNLECHLNGFRYTTTKGESIDIAFSNIKFAFFQPCENQIIAAIHFRLHEPIMVAKKKTEDIQFYSQGGTSAEDVVGRGGRGAREDSDDEERQKEARKKIDREFFAWTKACQEFIGNQFTFQMPDRNKGFYGTPFKGNCLIQPTKTCLINVTEIPFFILNLSEIQVACFERMYANLKSFDVTFVFKDYENNIRVNSIPVKDVQRVKDFLDDNGIIFYDLGKSMNWSKFLAGIRYDFKKFVEDGGWTAWDQEQGEEEEVQDGDSEFGAPEQELDESDSEDSDDDDESDYDQEDDSDDDQDEDLSEEGLSWDEMFERAEKDDRERLRRDIEKEKMVQRKKR